MKAKDTMELFRKEAAGMIDADLYEVWTVRPEAKDVHVTTTDNNLRTCQAIADRLIAENHGGTRYASTVSRVGMLGKFTEVTFCFNLTN